MPYIKQTDRVKLAYFDNRHPDNAGELNYLITVLCHQYVKDKGICYNILNEVVGVLDCAKQEFYRRIVSQYEDTKIKENGDVY